MAISQKEDLFVNSIQLIGWPHSHSYILEPMGAGFWEKWSFIHYIGGERNRIEDLNEVKIYINTFHKYLSYIKNKSEEIKISLFYVHFESSLSEYITRLSELASTLNTTTTTTTTTTYPIYSKVKYDLFLLKSEFEKSELLNIYLLFKEHLEFENHFEGIELKSSEQVQEESLLEQNKDIIKEYERKLIDMTNEINDIKERLRQTDYIN